MIRISNSIVIIWCGIVLDCMIFFHFVKCFIFFPWFIVLFHLFTRGDTCMLYMSIHLHNCSYSPHVHACIHGGMFAQVSSSCFCNLLLLNCFSFQIVSDFLSQGGVLDRIPFNILGNESLIILELSLVQSQMFKLTSIEGFINFWQNACTTRDFKF